MAKLILILGFFVFYSKIHPQTEWLSVAGLLIGAVGGLLSSAVTVQTRSIILGAAICILPFFCVGALSLFLIGAFGDRHQEENQVTSIIAGAIIILAGSLFYTSFSHPELSLIRENFYYGDLIGFLRSNYLVSAEHLKMLFSLAGLYYLSKAEKCQESLVYGLAFGLMASCSVAILQYFNAHPLLFHNMNPFWHSVGRVSGTFSDPNSFALVGVLALIFLRGSLLPVAVIVTLVLLLDGSRTFVVGALLCLVASLTRSRAVLFLAGVALVLVLFFTPPSVKRFIATINPETATQMLGSRIEMGTRAIENFSTSPVVGTGFGTFYVNQNSVDGWRDNAGNFYLEVLTEFGLVGFILFLLACLSLLKKEDNFFLLLVMLLLLTGSHLLSEEVRVIVVSILSISAPLSRRYERYALAYVIVPLFYLKQSSAGFYLPENDLRWTSKTAELRICEPTRFVEFRSLHPDVDINPISVKLDNKIVVVNSYQWYTYDVQKKKEVHIDVSRAWSPENDPRLLGIQVKWKDEFC